MLDRISPKNRQINKSFIRVCLLFLMLSGGAACVSVQQTAVLPTVVPTAEVPVTIVTVAVVATPSPTTVSTFTPMPSPTAFPTSTSRPQPTATTTSPPTATAAIEATETAVVPTLTSQPPTTAPTVPASPTSLPPTSAPSVPLPPSAVGAAAPQVYETTITIPTYDYEAAFQQSASDDPIFPYPRLEFSRIGPPTSRSYQAIVLELSLIHI